MLVFNKKALTPLKVLGHQNKNCVPIQFPSTDVCDSYSFRVIGQFSKRSVQFRCSHLLDIFDQNSHFLCNKN